MDFIRFNWNLIWISILNLFWIGSWHMSQHNRPVLIRLDHACELLDLKGLGWIWLKDTPSIKWFVLERLIKIQRLRFKREGAHRGGLGFRRGTSVRRTGGRSPASSGGFWETACPRRCAGGRGDLDCVNLQFDCVQRRRGRAARAAAFCRDVLDTVLRDGYEANDEAASCRGRAEGPGNLGGEIWRLQVDGRGGNFSSEFWAADGMGQLWIDLGLGRR
jgi:hypothetical protein